MSTEKEKHIGTSHIIGNPNERLVFKQKDESISTRHLANRAVTKDKMADGAVGWDELDHNLQNIIETGGGGGGAGLATDWGDSENLGITQKKLTEEHEEREAKDAEHDALLAEQGAAIADTYRKSETYNKEELNNMITTPNQKYKSYTAEDGDELSDILPATGEADTVYRVGNWDGEGYTEGCYSEYAWAGAETGYVPLSKKEPGIDEEPTAESDNLVKSGGVFKYVNDRGTKIILSYKSGIDDVKISAIKGHTYKFSLSDTTVFRVWTEQEGNARLGIFVKYEDEVNETVLYSDSRSKTIQEFYTYTLDSDKGTVEYVRISARIQQLKQLVCQIDDIEKSFSGLTSLKSGLIIDETSVAATELASRINKIEVEYVGDSSSYNDYAIYRPDGTPRKFRFRNFAQDSGTTLVDGARAIVWVEQDDGSLDGSHSGWYFIICRGENNVYHGFYKGFKVTVYTNGWGTPIVPIGDVGLEGVAEINFDLFKSAVDNLEYTHSILSGRNRFTSDLTVINNSVGGWTIRYPETDSVIKNEDGSFRVTLVKNDNNNPCIWLLFNFTDDIRGKSICWTFYAKKSEDSEGSVLRVNPNIPSSHPSITLSEEWAKYTFNTAIGSSNSDNRLMLFKTNSTDTLVFDIKDMQCWLVNDECYYDEQLTGLTQELSDSSNEIEKPFTNSLYKIASIERNITPEGVGAPQAIIALLGDSWTQHSWDTTPPGSQASPAHTNYVQPLKKYLQDKYGNAGGGFYSFSCSHDGKAKMGCADPNDADDVRGGTITYRDQVEGCRCVDAADATFMEGSTLLLNVKTNHNRFVIHFYGDSDAGVFTYQIDDEEAISVDASEYEGHTTIVVDTTDSTHTITFTAVSGDTMIFGVDMQRTSAGVRVHKIGNKGATTRSYTIVDVDCWKAMLDSLGIDSMTIMLGVNDGSTATSSVQRNLETIVSNIREINPYVDITIVQPSCTKTMDLTEQSEYSYKAASNLGVGYLSLIDLFGSPAKITDKGMFYDSLHPSLNGGRMIADYLIKKLLPTEADKHNYQTVDNSGVLSIHYDGEDVLRRFDVFSLKPATIYKVSYSCDTFPHTTDEGQGGGTGDWTLGVMAYNNGISSNLRTIKTWGLPSQDVYFCTPETFDFIRFGIRGIVKYTISVSEVQAGDKNIYVKHTNGVNYPIMIPASAGENITVSVRSTFTSSSNLTDTGVRIGYVLAGGTSEGIRSINNLQSKYDVVDITVPAVSGMAGIYIQLTAPFNADYVIEVKYNLYVDNAYTEDNITPFYSRLNEYTTLYTQPSTTFWGPFQYATVAKDEDKVVVGISKAVVGAWPGIRMGSDQSPYSVPAGIEKVAIKFRYKSPKPVYVYLPAKYEFPASSTEWAVAEINDIDASTISRLQISVSAADMTELETSFSYEVKDFCMQECKIGSIDDIVRKLAISNPSISRFAGKKISIMGDSISTASNNNAVEFTVLESDVTNSRTLQGYPTFYDVGVTIGSKTVTSSDIGVLTSFTPTSSTDIGKKIGEPYNYNQFGQDKTWWGIMAQSLGATILQNVSWSGASMSSHENDVLKEGNYIYKTSYAWHDAQINKLSTRDEEGNTVNPDVVIIYRGVNDMSHRVEGHSDALTDFGAASTSIPNNDIVNTDQYGFKEAYAITIKKIRAKYPFAYIVCCTLNVFNRGDDDPTFPTVIDGKTLPQFNNAIREIADMFGCGLIEFDKDGITLENCYPTYINDSSSPEQPTHPNQVGHAKMAEKAIIDMLKI